MMRKKKMSLRPAITAYLGAVAAGRGDGQKLRSFLTVTDKALENETPAVIASYFELSRTLFERHALHYEKTFRLYVGDEDYAFDYVVPAQPFDLNETSSTASTDEQDNTEPAPQDVDQAIDTSFQVAPPLWMSPPPQPIAEGPIVRFTRATLTFVTSYDSVFLRNAKGVVSARSNLFIGEEGSFDWTSAGLGTDVVNCNLAAYNFNVKKPELKADLAKLSYAGKTPGVIPQAPEEITPGVVT